MDDRTTVTERLREIIAAKDVKRFSEIMDELGYPENIANYCDCRAHNRQMSYLYGIVSAITTSSSGGICEGMCELLIDRTYMKINIGRFLALVVTAGRLKAGDYSAVPQNIRTALKNGNYSESIAEQMCGLTEAAMEQLVAYVAYEIEDIRMGYKRPVIRAAFFGTKVPTDLLLAYLSTSIGPSEMQEMTVIPVMASGLEDDLLSGLMDMLGVKKPENGTGSDSSRLDDA